MIKARYVVMYDVMLLLYIKLMNVSQVIFLKIYVTD